jgi:hypothetical protein
VADFYWRSQRTTGADLRRLVERIEKKKSFYLDEQGDLRQPKEQQT